MQSVSSTTGFSTSKGMSGLVSGMDTESMVKDLLAGTQNKIDKQEANKTQIEWKQEQYRDVISTVSNFKNTFMNFLKPETNIMAEAFFNSMSSDVKSDCVNVTATNKALVGNLTINSITQLATKTSLKSVDNVTDMIKGKIDITAFDDAVKADGKNPTITINVDGVEKTITLSDTGSKSREENILDNLSDDIKKQFGSGIQVNKSTNGTFSILDEKSSSIGARHIIITGQENQLNAVSLHSGISNQITMNMSLKDINFDKSLVGSEYEFSINGEKIICKDTDSISSIIKKINSSKAGVNVVYSSVEDKFLMTTKETGAGFNINIEQTKGNLMTAMFGYTGPNSVPVNAGQNAKFSIKTSDGTAIAMEKSTNSFNLDGLDIELKKETNSAIEIDTTRDNKQILDGVVKFVDEYNKMIDKINKLVSEKAEYKKYPPLTKDQKKEMTDKEIEDWENKSKKGLLNGDPLIGCMLSEMRSLLYSKPVGTDFALYQMGITTSDKYEEKGKLVVKDEAKLKEVIANRADEITALFTSKDGGIGKAMDKTIDKYTKSSVVFPGLLVKHAGVKSTISETKNVLSREKEQIIKNIDRLKKMYKVEKQRYWKKFTQMEKIIGQMNSQSSWLGQQFM